MSKQLYQSRTPETQKNYAPWELKVMVAASGEVTADQLATLLGRSPSSISTKCSLIGVKTKRKARVTKC